MFYKKLESSSVMDHPVKTEVKSWTKALREDRMMKLQFFAGSRLCQATCIT